jgi:lipoprotein signal peptidase
MSLKKATLLILIILLVDQISKIYIKTNFIYGEAGEIKVAEWFRIMLIENEGMAWGTVIPGEYGKLFLTIFRIFAVFGIAYWLWSSVKTKASNYLIVAISLIFAGAFGMQNVMRYLDAKSEIIMGTSNSKNGFLINSAITSKRQTENKIKRVTRIF